MSGINPMDVVEIRATWGRMKASPWAGFGMRHAATLADGQVVALMGYEAGALLDELKARGARLVEVVEGWSRIVRVTSDERRVPSEVKRALRPATVAEAVDEMIARGATSWPKLRGRLEAAGELVLGGRVERLEEGSARIGPYRIDGESCTCGDFRHRKGWCKHRLAVRMARHLVANGFELPRAVTETTPQISAANRALIASGQVVDSARRRELAYRESVHGARSTALRQLGNGARTLPAELARRAGIGPGDEIRNTSEERQ